MDPEETAPAPDGRVTATLSPSYPIRQRYDIATDTTGIEIGVSTRGVVRQMFDAVPWLAQCTQIDSSRGDPLHVPRRSLIAGAAGADEDWGAGFDVIGEGDRDATAEDPSFDTPVILGSHKAQWTPVVSWEMLRDRPQFEAELTADAGIGMALVTALWAVAGSGVSQGTGLRTVLRQGAYTSRRVLGTEDDYIPTYEELSEVFKLVPRAYRMLPSCGWLTSDENWITLRHEVADSQARPILDSDGNIFNKPVYTSPGFPAFGQGATVALAFGDLKSIAIRRIEDMRFEESDAPEFLEDKASFAFRQSLDTNVIDRRGLAFFNSKS